LGVLLMLGYVFYQTYSGFNTILNENSFLLVWNIAPPLTSRTLEFLNRLTV